MEATHKRTMAGTPARSTGVALFVDDWAIGQLWFFWLTPIMGALLGAVAYHFIASEES